MSEMLEETNRLQLLFDFYGKLLKDKQRQYFEMYYEEDLSLGEIAELLEVSRQAVFDQVKRVGKQLEQYESKLQLLTRDQERRKLLSSLKKTLCDNPHPQALELVNQLLALEMDIDEEADHGL